MQELRLRSLLWPALVFGSSLQASFPCCAQGWRTPSRDDEVVAVVRPGRRSAGEREAAALQAAVARDPRDAVGAVKAAGRMIELARAEGDPRWLGRARSVLEPWWTDSAAPVGVLVARATVLQGLHDFAGALTVLDVALSHDPRCAQAWLLKSSVLTVRGDYEGARRACVPLIRLADNLVATVAAGTVSSLCGGAEQSTALIHATLRANPDAPVAVRVWAMTQMAEASERLGRFHDAERHFTNALQLAPSDPYLLGAFADFLLAEKRPAEVVDWLRPHVRVDSLALRFAEACAALPEFRREAVREAAQLEDKFTAARMRGDRVHLREEARFELRLKRSPEAALRLALDNWEIQREPADIRLLIEAARAAGDGAVEREVRAWVSEHRLEDARIPAPLAKEAR
jgi:Tfp pilus assembly protein PilF